MRNTCLFAILLCYCLFGVVRSASAQQPAREDYILLLNSANFGEAWSDAVGDAFVRNSDQWGVAVRKEALQVPLMRSMDEVHAKQQALLEKYPTPPRAVIFIGDPGWLVLRPLFENEWKDVPTLICYSRGRMPFRTEDLLSGRLNDRTLRPAEEVTHGYNLTVLRQPSYIRETIEAMQRMLPRMERVVFISDQRYISGRVRDEMSKILAESFPALQFEPITTPEVSTEQLLERMEQCDEKTGVIYYSWFVTEHKTQISYLDDNVQKILFGFTRTPIFSVTDRNQEVGDFAGGYYILASDFAKDVVSTIHEILNGVPARDIPWRNGGSPALYLNYSHLERHSVPVELFPREAIYSQAPPGFLQKYKFELVVVAAVLLLLFVGGILLVRILLQRQRHLHREYLLSERYRRLVDNMPVGYIRLRQLSDSDDFIFLDVNTAFEEAFGCNYEQLVGKRMSELKPRFEKLSCISLRPGEDQFDLATAAGERHYHRLMLSSSENGVQDIFYVDRTEERLARQRIDNHNKELQELYEKYKLVLRATGLTPWIWDLRTELIDCDFEYTQGEYGFEGNRLVVPAQQYYEMICPEDRERIRQAYIDLHAGVTDILQQEYRVYYAPGETCYTWTKSFAIVKERDADGKPTLLVGASLQIDNQKALEQELRDAKEQAEESNRLKSAFLANMSHEIRTPLNAIVGFSRVLTEIADEQERQPYVEMIETNTKLLLQLINDILDLSKIEAGMFKFLNTDVNLNELFAGLEQDARMRINKPGVEFVTELPAEGIHLVTDPNRLMQVVMNFITNAIKFTEQGSIRFGYRAQENGELYFYVADTGCGISPACCERVFGRFEKLNNFAQGTGLGLSICKSIVEQMNGRIGVNSEVGRGSEFWFTVPRTAVRG